MGTKLVIKYDPNEGLAIEDGWIESEFLELLKVYNQDLDRVEQYSYSTSLFFYRLKLAIVLGDLKSEDVTFKYGDTEFFMDRRGNYIDKDSNKIQVDGFCNQFADLTTQIIFSICDQ